MNGNVLLIRITIFCTSSFSFWSRSHWITVFCSGTHLLGFEVCFAVSNSYGSLVALWRIDFWPTTVHQFACIFCILLVDFAHSILRVSRTNIPTLNVFQFCSLEARIFLDFCPEKLSQAVITGIYITYELNRG